jgi:hypothetical protein
MSSPACGPDCARQTVPPCISTIDRTSCEPEPEPALPAQVRGIRLPEGIEHVREERRVDALARVAHGDDDVVAVTREARDDLPHRA